MTGGHGHVTPRPDGAKARCGGPAICATCRAEQAAASVATVTIEADASGAVAALTEMQTLLGVQRPLPAVEGDEDREQDQGDAGDDQPPQPRG